MCMYVYGVSFGVLQVTYDCIHYILNHTTWRTWHDMPLQHNTTQHNTTQHNTIHTILHNKTQHNTTQYTQSSTTKHHEMLFLPLVPHVEACSGTPSSMRWCRNLCIISGSPNISQLTKNSHFRLFDERGDTNCNRGKWMKKWRRLWQTTIW